MAKNHIYKHLDRGMHKSSRQPYHEVAARKAIPIKIAEWFLLRTYDLSDFLLKLRYFFKPREAYSSSDGGIVVIKRLSSPAHIIWQKVVDYFVSPIYAKGSSEGKVVRLSHKAKREFGGVHVSHDRRDVQIMKKSQYDVDPSHIQKTLDENSLK
jgi:hypothetical protein